MKFNLNRLSQEETKELERLIEDLKSKGGAEGLCQGLMNIITKKTVSFETFYLLSRRCNTGGPHKSAEDISHRISMLLFSEILPRPSNSEFTVLEICMI